MSSWKADRSAVLEVKEKEAGGPSHGQEFSSNPMTTESRPNPSKAKPELSGQSLRAKDEWLIDESTSKLYLSLLADQEAGIRGGQVRPAPRPIPGRRERSLPPAVAREKAEPVQATIGLDEGYESTTRFVLYAALLVGFSFLIYGAISWSGHSSNPRGAHGQASRTHQTTSSAIPRSGVNPPETPSTNSPISMVSVTEPSLTMVPALILDATQPNQSSTHTFVVHNRTPFEMVFGVEARDLVLRAGKAAYLPPGEVEGSVAATLTYSTRELELKPMQSASLDITLTMPDKTAVRGVAVLLNSKGSTFQGADGSMAASLGSMISIGIGSPGDNRQGPASPGPAGPAISISQWVVDPPRPCPGSDSSPSLREGEALDVTAGDSQ